MFPPSSDLTRILIPITLEMQENLPSIPGVNQTPHFLSQQLCTLLSTSIQKIILPPLYNPTLTSSRGELDSSRGSDSQKVAFEENQKRTSKSLDLPVGGGPFKGFAFAVVGTSSDAMRILQEWVWNSEESGSGVGEEAKDVEAEKEESDKSEERKYAKLAKENGLRVLSL